MQTFFQASIVQSAPMAIPFRTYQQYVTPATLLAEELKCGIIDIKCLRRQTYQDIAAAQTKVNSMLTSFDFLLFFEPWVPVVDNNIVKGQLIDVVRNVSFPLKPLTIGTLTEEAIFYVYEGWAQPVSITTFLEVIAFTFRENAVKVLERYPPSQVDDQRPLMSKIATQWVFACSSRIYTRKAGSYAYVFGFPLDFDGWENETFCNNHVCHAGELPYTFQSTWVNFTDAGRNVASAMGTYWTNFAKSFNPNTPVSWPVQWPKMNLTDEPYLYFQNPLDVRKQYLKDECDFWDKIGYKADAFYR